MSNRESEERALDAWLAALAYLPRCGFMALDGRKLILALTGLVLLWAGWDSLGRAFPGSRGLTPLPEPRLPLDGDHLGWGLIREAAAIAAEPMRLVGEPARELFRSGRGNWHFVHALLATIWAVLVWGVAGGAIARIAVVELATGVRISVLKAVRYILDRARPLLLAPASIALMFAVIAGVCALIGLLYRIPSPAGEIIGGVLLFVPLLLGCLLLAAGVGLAAGWPLMVVSVATEGDDALDAVSRSFSYVFQRLIAYAALVLVAWVIGSVGLVIVQYLGRGVVTLCRWGLSFGAPDGRIDWLLGDGVVGATGAAAALHAGWLALVSILVYCWVFSYFWCALTQIYLILRKQVDGTSMREVDEPVASLGVGGGGG